MKNRKHLYWIVLSIIVGVGVINAVMYFAPSALRIIAKDVKNSHVDLDNPDEDIIQTKGKSFEYFYTIYLKHPTEQRAVEITDSLHSLYGEEWLCIDFFNSLRVARREADYLAADDEYKKKELKQDSHAFKKYSYRDSKLHQYSADEMILVKEYPHRKKYKSNWD